MTPRLPFLVSTPLGGPRAIRFFASPGNTQREHSPMWAACKRIRHKAMLRLELSRLLEQRCDK